MEGIDWDLFKISGSQRDQKTTVTTVLTEDMFLRVNVPGDGSCLFWAVTMAYLLPVRNNESLFSERCARLFGAENVNKTFSVFKLIENNDFSCVYEDKTLTNLVSEKFRNRIVNEMTKQEKVFESSISLNDFLYMRNAAFITDGIFAQQFQSAFPSLKSFVDLNKLKPGELNEKTIECLDGELDKMLENGKLIQKFKFECYLRAMRSRESWAGEREIQTIKRMLKCQIFIFDDNINKRLILKTNALSLCIFNDHEIHFEFGLIKAEIISKALIKKDYRTVLALLNFGVDEITFLDKISQIPVTTENYYYVTMIEIILLQVAPKKNNLPLKMFATETCSIANASSYKNLNNYEISEQEKVTYNQLGRSILHSAVEANNLEIVKQILNDSEQSFLLNAPTNDDKKQTALHLAVLGNNLAIVECLVGKSAKVNVKDFNVEMIEKFPNWSPLHYAAENGYLEIAKILVEKGKADVNIKDYSRGSPLQRAIRFGHLDMVKFLVERGANVNSKDKTLVSVLSHAARLGFDHIGHFLLAKGAKINAVDQHRMTAVHHAVKCSQWNTVKMLVESGADLNTQSDGNKSPLSRVVMAGKWDVVRYLLNNNALLVGLSEKYKREIFNRFIGENQFEEQIYRAIMLGNVEILELLIAKNNVNVMGILSLMYEKLKLQNLPLNQSMCLYIEDKLINFRFFSENETKIKGNSNDNFDTTIVKERLKLVINCADSLVKIEKVNEEYLFIGKFLAKNMQILKRQLFCTYDQLPWEEMQFCLLTFISSYVYPKKVEFINKLVMNQKKLNSYLTVFKIKLESLEKSLDDNFVFKKMKFKREKAVENILNKSSEFRELFEDYEILKDVYSLNQIEKHIKIACSINVRSKPVIGQLVVERALQVIGECLKNTPESPNMSESVQNMLIKNAPLNLKAIITSLRDSLSHVETLTKREDLSQNDANFFPQMQNDLKKMETEITYIIYNKKMEAFKRCLGEILKCENVEEVREIVSGIEMNQNVVILTGQRVHHTFYKVESLVRDFEKLIVGKSERQLQCFEDIFEAVEKYKARIELVQNTHKKSIYLINSLIDLVKSSDNLGGVKKRIRGFLSTVEDDNYELWIYEYVLELIVNIFNSCPSKSELTIKDTFYQIFSTIEFECKRMKNIDRFKFSFEKKAVDENDEKIRDEIIRKIDSKFTTFINKVSDLDSRNLFIDEYEKKKKLNETRNVLIDFYKRKNVEIDLIGFTELMKNINLKLSKNESYSSLHEENDDSEQKKLVQRINRVANDSYGKLIKKLTNEPDNAFMQNAFSEFVRSFVSAKKLPSNFIDVNEKLFCDVELYFKKLKTLENLFEIEKNDQDLIKLMRVDDHLRVAIEMLMLTLVEILENLSLLETNPLFLDEPTPVLIGKNLRNYLAHGDLLMEVLSIDHFQSIVSHYHILKRNCDLETKSVYAKNELIGKRTLENVPKLNSEYQTNLQFIKKQNEMFANAKLIIDTKFLNQNLEINGRKTNGWTLLNSAAETDNVQLFNYLLNYDLNIYQKDAFGNTILFYLPQFGCKKILKFLLQNLKIDINFPMYSGRTMLHVASQFNHNEVVELLILNGADIEAADNRNITAVNFAAVNDNSKVVLTLLKAGANVETTNDDGESLLHVSAIKGNLELAKSLIEYGCSVNHLDTDHRTPLHFACMNGHEHVVMLLIENGAEINTKSKNEGNALLYATQEGHEGVVEILLANEADIKLKGKFGNTALHVAAFLGFENLVPVLIKYGAEVNAKNHKDLTALHAAAVTGHHQLTIAALLENGAKVNDTTADGTTPLHLAAQNNCPRSVQVLLENGALVNARCTDGNTPLHLTFNLEIIEMLLNAHADINGVNNSGRTSLYIATLYNKLPAVELLISRGAKIDAADNEDVTPLIVAASKGHLQIFQVLQNARVNLFHSDKSGWTTLHVAAQHNHKEIVKLIIAENRDKINSINNMAQTALHIAAQNGHFEVVKILIENKADVNLADSLKWTTLHYASTNGHYKVVSFLLTKNSRVDVFNMDGSSPLHLAAKHGHKDVLDVILSKNAEMVDIGGAENVTPLQLAATLGHLDAVKFLLGKGSDVNAKTDTHWTALHLATEKGHSFVVRHLLDQGALANSALENGCTPLHIAAQNGHETVAFALMYVKADVNARYDNSRCTALHKAAEIGSTYLVYVLIKYGAEVNSVDVNEKTPLHWLAEKGWTEPVIIFSEAKANMNAKDVKNWTPLHVAAEHDRLDCLIRLAHYGADIYSLTNDNWTALHVACQRGNFNAAAAILALDKSSILINKVTDGGGISALQMAAEIGDVEIVQLLVNKMADVDYAEPKGGWTALHFATHRNHAETVECLIKNRAKLDIKSADGATALHGAVSFGLEAIVRVLCRAGADFNGVTNKSYAPLHLAAEKNDVSVANVLIKAGAKVNAGKNDGATPLHIAAIMGHSEMTELLVEAGAEIERKAQSRLTPLHVAAQNARANIVSLLLKKGAKVNETFLGGFTALHWAAQNGHSKVVETLLSFEEVNVNAKNSSNVSPLHVAVKFDRLEMAQMLIENGADVFALDDHDTVLHKAIRSEKMFELILREIIKKADGYEEQLSIMVNARDNEGDTPLMWAAKGGHVNSAKMLLKCGVVDVDRFNVKGMTALHWAAQNGHRDVVELLIDSKANVEVKNDKGQSAFDVAMQRASVDEKYDTIAGLILSVTATK